MTEFAAILQPDPLMRAIAPMWASIEDEIRTEAGRLSRRGFDEEQIAEELLFMFHDLMPHAPWDLKAVEALAKAIHEGALST